MRECSRTIRLEVFLGKVVLKICSKFKGEHPSKSEFNILHFGMGVLLYIKFAACTFSEHIFLRTPLDDCFWYRLFSTLSNRIWKGVNLHVVETKWETENLKIKIFITLLHTSVNKSIFREVHKKKRKNHGPALIQTVFHSQCPLLGMRKSTPKKFKNNVFPIYFIFFKGSCTLKLFLYT